MRESAKSGTPSCKPGKAYDLLFTPGSIVVVGASNDPLKPGGRVFKNIKENGYTGELWAVNPKAASIQGCTTYASIAAMPRCPDLAIVAIPARGVVAALEDLAAKGAGAVVVLTSGFGEKDEEGKLAESKMLEIARRSGMTLIGPNCSGFLTPHYKGKFAGLIPGLGGRAVDFISGSGATVDYVMEQATLRGLSFGTVVNVGNSIQVGVEDLLALFDENYGPAHAPILMLYMESVRKPQELLKHAASLTSKGCVLVGIKSGVSEAGQQAAASHTGAMATRDVAVDALFERAGIIRVRSKAELIDVACVLDAAGGPLKGKRVCVVTDAGGPGVMLSDELERQGLDLPELSQKTRERLRGVLPPESSVSNPIDCLPSRTGAQIKGVLEILVEEEREHIDVIVVVTGDSGMSDNWEIYEEILNAMETCPIPVIPVLSSALTSREMIDRFAAAGRSYFQDEVQLGSALGKVAGWSRPGPAAPELTGYDRQGLDAVMAGLSGVLPQGVVYRVLESAGFRPADQVELSRHEDLSRACRKVGFPLVMKVMGPLHKSDVGGVKVDIRDEGEAEAAWPALMAIEGATGVMVQKMVDGIEVILGASREGDFGHLILFGLGGIYTEVLKDVRFGLAPLNEMESMRMIRSLRSFPILEGVRGMGGVSVELLSDHLMRLAMLVTDFPQIREIDLNPVKGFGTDLVVVDARMILES